MQKDKIKQLIPHLVAILIFIAVSGIYFYPQLKGLQLNQGDTQRHGAMSKEINDFREKYHKEPLWTNSMFSGMPAYQISTLHSNYVDTFENGFILKVIPRPIGYLFVAMVGFYILMLCFGVSPWIGIIGAIAFGLASINILYLVGGHNSKVHAIALLPALIGSILLAYRKNLKLGALLLAFFVCLELSANHLQMTYYALFLIAAIVIAEFFIHWKNKLLAKFIKTSLILLVAGIIGVLPNISNLLTTSEYGEYSTRGKSELTITPKNGQQTTSAEALDANYITQYNLGYGEVWSLIIPDVKGGAMNYIGNKENIINKTNRQYREYIAKYPSYWGEQESSGGAFYFGASIFLLFVLGMVFIKDTIKWAFFGASLLAIFLSWKYGPFIDFFINHFPLFNKFRDTKMILLIAQISFPFIGLLFIKELLNASIDKKKLIYTLIAVNGVLFLFYVGPEVWFDFFGSAERVFLDKQLNEYQSNPAALQQITDFQNGIKDARIMIFKLDVLRSLLFTILISSLVYLFVAKKIKTTNLLIALGILVLVDLWLVDKRYLNNEKNGREYNHWIQKKEYANPFRASMADNFILANEVSSNPALSKSIEDAINSYSGTNSETEDAELIKEKVSYRELNFGTNYRVFTLPNPFANAEISYFHKSIGGYHGAKLKKYQELIDFYLIDEMTAFYQTLQDSAANTKLDNMLNTGIPMLNMLNTKYIIYNPNAPAIINPYAMGNCWFVGDIQFVENADAEMLSLGNTNVKTSAIINTKYKTAVAPFKLDSTASIQLTDYKPNHLTYKSKTNTPQFAVFSEIYYPKGWNAYVDGKMVSYINANYVLRAMNIPAGEHTIEFRFEPQSYITGNKISMASSLLLLLLVIGALGFEAVKWVKS